MKLHVPVHERDAEANELDLILIDEFRFPHAIMSIKPEQISADELNYTYKKIAGFLNLHNSQDAGITVIATPSFMFVGCLYQPYHIEPEIRGPSGEETDVERHELNLYIDGLGYAGMVNLQDQKQVWPATASGNSATHTVLDSLSKQSNVPEM